MAAQTSAARTSGPQLQYSMEHPSDEFIRSYALEVFGDIQKVETWLVSEIPALGGTTPETLLATGVEEDLRRVLGVLVQIDYGVIG